MPELTDLGKGRVVIVTGAARGIGAAEARAFAERGFRVVVNDLGADLRGDNPQSAPANELAEEIRSNGGEAIANGDDVADFEGARRLIHSAVETWGRLDVLVNNAGILRDRTIANMSAEEWDAVIRVHLRGTFATTRHAAAYWRDLAKSGHDVDARIINTTSSSGLYGNPGQANYGAAKAGIAALTIITSQELARYGITVNAIAPLAHTRMTDDRPAGDASRRLQESDPETFNPYAADNIAPLVVWLGTDAARDITGRVFNVRGGTVEVAQPWTHGPKAVKEASWTIEELDSIVPALLRQASPIETMKPVKRKGDPPLAATQ